MAFRVGKRWLGRWAAAKSGKQRRRDSEADHTHHSGTPPKPPNGREKKRAQKYTSNSFNALLTRNEVRNIHRELYCECFFSRHDAMTRCKLASPARPPATPVLPDCTVRPAGGRRNCQTDVDENIARKRCNFAINMPCPANISVTALSTNL
jgi:hypothetical protein